MAGCNDQEISTRLSAVQGWDYVDGQLTRTFEFGSFLDAIAFVERVARAAETADHHPDIDIRYSSVRMAVSSHDVGGITDRDFGLAETVSALA